MGQDSRGDAREDPVHGYALPWRRKRRFRTSPHRRKLPVSPVLGPLFLSGRAPGGHGAPDPRKGLALGSLGIPLGLHLEGCFKGGARSLRTLHRNPALRIPELRSERRFGIDGFGFMMASMKSALKILILDNTRDASSFGSPNLFALALRTAPKGSEILVRRAPELDFNPDFKADAILVSGSITSCIGPYEDWISRFDEFLTKRIRSKTPILGVCFGHQSLARCLFQMKGIEPALCKSPKPEVGWQTMRVTAESKLFQGLGPEFTSYQSHYEEVGSLPPGTRLLAESPRCRIQAFEVEDAPVFGIQFHPEHGPDHAEKAMKQKIDKGERGDWILHPGRSHELFDETVGNTIFGNFFRLAQSS
ncbi:MAG: type 1 glutamine amidotransferase [Proteobacteria bacterium]|nr:type 1 glutamine amidotransferase [Pseudomonadota bacterium]